VFTGGIGENADITREGVCDNLNWLGFELDKTKNTGMSGKEAVISTDNSKVKIMVVPTNEELMIAMDTQKIVEE
jgi:acetate kinase